MSGNVIVVLADQDDSRRGEITVVDNPRTAVHLVETLLEAGFQRERIRLFSGERAEMRVSARPVVALVGDPPATDAADSLADRKAEPEPAKFETSGEEATPFIKDGVRFSSLFRPA